LARSPPSQPKEDVSGVDLNDCEAVDLHGCDEAFANVDYDALGNELDDDDGADDEQMTVPLGRGPGLEGGLGILDTTIVVC
jgi:hypothetical protein